MPISFEPGAPTPDGFVPLCVPWLYGNEWKYVKECLDTNFVSSVGPFVGRFEGIISKYLGAKHAIATVNGTAALHIALLISGVCPNDEVLVSTLTFISPANAVRYVGAWPVFIDVEHNNWQMDPEKVIEFLKKCCHWNGKELLNMDTGRRVKAIIPVHILGHPVDIDPIIEIAHKYNLIVIEDAAESLGAKYRGQMVGHLGDIACLSFNGNKIITSGGGGMIITDNDKWAEKARYLTTQAKYDPIEYIHNEIGFNYRLTNIQAAIGYAQMEVLDKCINAKRKIAFRYAETLNNIQGLTLMEEASWAFSTYWLYTILIDPQRCCMGRKGLMKRLSDLGIQTRPLWQPLHKSLAHFKSQSYQIKIADAVHDNALSLPSSVGLSKDDQTKVIEAIKYNIQQ